MRRLAVATALLLVSTTALIFTAPVASAATTTICTGTISNQNLISVEVPHHAWCVLENVNVKNNVTAVDPSDLDIFHSAIKGTLDVNDSAGNFTVMEVSCTTIGAVRVRNIDFNDEFSLDGGTDEAACGPNFVKGNVLFSNNQGEVDLENTTVGGTVKANGNNAVDFEGNTIHGDRLCSNNSSVNLSDPQDFVQGRDTCQSVV